MLPKVLFAVLIAVSVIATSVNAGESSDINKDVSGFTESKTHSRKKIGKIAETSIKTETVGKAIRKDNETSAKADTHQKVQFEDNKTSTKSDIHGKVNLKDQETVAKADKHGKKNLKEDIKSKVKGDKKEGIEISGNAKAKVNLKPVLKGVEKVTGAIIGSIDAMSNLAKQAIGAIFETTESIAKDAHVGAKGEVKAGSGKKGHFGKFLGIH